MLEWLKRHAWKACIRQNRISGSNPDLSAPTGRSLLRPVLVSYLLKVYFHKGVGYKDHDVRRASVCWCKGLPGKGSREETCVARLIPIFAPPQAGGDIGAKRRNPGENLYLVLSGNDALFTAFPLFRRPNSGCYSGRLRSTACRLPTSDQDRCPSTLLHCLLSRFHPMWQKEPESCLSGHDSR